MTRIAHAAALLALALLTAAALAAPAGANKPHPQHGKGADAAKVLPKQWVKRHHVKGAKADPDGDGLTNWGEFRSHTRPKSADSDADGTGDGEEDRDRDELDNGSEEDARTDPGRKDTDGDGTKDGAEDTDRDGLANAAEDRTGNDPRDPDTDGDGIPDGKENAGVVKAFDGTTLTIALATGGSLTAAVDEQTDVLCDDDGGFDDEGDLDDEFGDDASEDDAGDEPEGDGEVTASLAEQGDEDAADDERGEAGDERSEAGDDAELGACGADIPPGTPVHQASVENGVFVVLELLTSGD
jgi:hypothetical protein